MQNATPYSVKQMLIAQCKAILQDQDLNPAKRPGIEAILAAVEAAPESDERFALIASSRGQGPYWALSLFLPAEYRGK